MLSEKVLKPTCLILQAVCFICGVVIFALGIWAVTNDQLNKLVDAVMFAGMYVMIVAGAIIILTSFLGCIACRRESKPLVVIYSIVTLIAIFLKVVGCIIIFDYFIDARTQLIESRMHYGRNETITDLWDKMQKEGECCGFLKYWDWDDFPYYEENQKYPTSCCVIENGKIKHEGHCHIAKPGHIHVEGCEYVLEKYYYGVGGTAVGVIILELISVLLLACHYQYYP